MNYLKKSKMLRMMYENLMLFLRVYMPVTRAKIAYYLAYKSYCNLSNPKTFSEKLLWLSLHTYMNNKEILDLSDKYLVREYVRKKIGDNILNEVYFVQENPDDIKYEDLPSCFVLKCSQGCTTNFFCMDKTCINADTIKKVVLSWHGSKQYLYDKLMADIGGIKKRDLKKYYICEQYMLQQGESSLIDYKIYCFNGIPKAILVVADRFENINGVFMSVDWKELSRVGDNFHYTNRCFERPRSLETMLNVANILSRDFPFVRVDMYDIDGKAVFGELTFFPGGCVNMKEVTINGKTMGELLDISCEIESYNENKERL